MDKLFINLWEIGARSGGGGGEREKLYLLQEKGQEKETKNLHMFETRLLF